MEMLSLVVAVVGLILIVPLNVLSAPLTERYSNWRATRSTQKTLARMQRIEAELHTLENLTAHPAALVPALGVFVLHTLRDIFYIGVLVFMLWLDGRWQVAAGMDTHNFATTQLVLGCGLYLYALLVMRRIAKRVLAIEHIALFVDYKEQQERTLANLRKRVPHHAELPGEQTKRVA